MKIYVQNHFVIHLQRRYSVSKKTKLTKVSTSTSYPKNCTNEGCYTSSYYYIYYIIYENSSILVDLSLTSSGFLKFTFSLAHGTSLISFDTDSMQRSIYRHVYLLILR